ncbi:MAG: ABC transporter permease [Candidatus Riflebacteria bacterium]|nr:ABC transporter permease [Candidatus Riflebacteria bacterium]
MDFFLEVFSGAFARLFALDEEAFRVFFFTLKVGLLGTGVGLLVSLPLAWGLFCLPSRWKNPVLILFQMLLSVPTVIVGTLVYLFISRRGPLGALEMMFTPSAIVTGEVLLIVPLITVFLHSSLAQIPVGLIDTAVNLEIRGLALLRLLVRECRSGLGVAACVGFGRVVSEVGVAMILGGNIKGFTRTLTTAIALETAKGDTELALALGIMLLGVALGNALLVHGLQVAAARRQAGKAVEEPAGFPAPAITDRFADAASLPEVPPLKLDRLAVSFHGRDLFGSLSGELPLTGGTALMGASGAGKTILLKVIAGVIPPSAGTVDRQGRRAILVFQRPFLFSGTVRENLLIGHPGRPEEAGKTCDRMQARATELGIAHLLDREVGGLSGGEAARVSLARALLACPDLLLVDETLGHLDPVSLARAIQVLEGFLKAGGGLLLVTHDRTLGERLCRRIIQVGPTGLQPLSGSLVA